MYSGLGCGGPYKEEHLHAIHTVRNKSNIWGENVQGKPDCQIAWRRGIERTAQSEF